MCADIWHRKQRKNSGCENMLHIILGILKIIGIVLAVLLLLILLLLLGILFVPVRYRIAGSGSTENLKEAKAKVNISWLLHIIDICAEYMDGAFKVRLRIFGIPKVLYPAQEKKEKRAKRPKAEKPQAVEVTEEAAPQIEQKDEAAKPVQEEVPQTEEKPAEAQNETQAQLNETEKKKSIREKINGILDKIKDIREKIKSIWEKICAIPEKIRNICDKIHYYIEILKSETFKTVAGRGWKYIKYILRHIRPRKIKGSLHYGLDDPSLTGQITGAAYLLLPENCEKVRLLPDFEKKICEGDLIVKGHIRLCHLAYVGLRLLFDKELRRLLKMLKA